ncbi:LysR family transcriptional regulator ArgP [Asaia platycodi]|uniref:LysR family transcriptional regulator ArgP n=1 Tax=Asaia platycodi TaxID=610243 RepID=UPI0004727346|nr:LysR family transcriptional regulator ArgP [Asaia platycodi]
MFDYSALSAVAAVIREGSFEGAARVLRITSSAVSQRVRSFEDRLGALLIVRGYPCKATALGQLLSAHVEQVRLLEADIHKTSGLPLSANEGKIALRLAVNIDSLATWLPKVMTQYALERGICIDLQVEDVAMTADLFRSGDVMAAVTTRTDLLQGCKAVYLGSMHYAACARPDFVVRYFPDGFTPEAIDAAPCICLEAQDSLQKQWLELMERPELSPMTHYVPSSRGVLDFTLSGLGWGLQPVTLAAPHLASGDLVEIDPGRRLQVPLYWILPRLKSAILDELTAHLKKQCAEHPAFSASA